MAGVDAVIDLIVVFPVSRSVDRRVRILAVRVPQLVRVLRLVQVRHRGWRCSAIWRWRRRTRPAGVVIPAGVTIALAICMAFMIVFAVDPSQLIHFARDAILFFSPAG